MADRTVRVTLSAQVQQYIDGMEKAAQATREAGTEGEKLAQQRAAFQSLGTTMVGVGGAITAVGLAAVKTGIDYNSMQQSSRAALLTMLGSTEAVNAQMQKLDDFAQNSPFAKQTFIEAQQQMLAFGIETEKVIPMLDAVQNAVAAAGGSNADIEGIVATMSKIQSSAKITAQDLNEFGNRGVNAAELIGSQMGLTGAEIREKITAGTLGATEALDMLAAGMSDRFAGAADNVKQTFDGAMDRVKAAWRDFSAELARPLVDPEGGGALVDFLNGLADTMRWFEGLPEPVKDTTTTIIGLAGALSLAGGTALLMAPKVAEFKNALTTLEIDAARVNTTLGNIAPIATAFASVPIAAQLARWGDELRGTTTNASDLERQLRTTGVAASDLERGLTGGSGFRGLGLDAELAANNLRTLDTGIGRIKAWFDNTMLGEAMSVPFLGLGREAGLAQKQIEELDTAMAGMVASGATDSAAEAYEYFAEKAAEAGWSTERIAEALPEYTQAVKEAGPATQTSAERAAEAASAYNEQADAARAATDELFRLIDALMESNSVAQDAEGANAKYQETLAKVAEHVANAQAGVEGYSTSLDANTVEGSKNREMLAGMAADSQAAALKIMEQETATLGASAATENYKARLDGGRQSLYDTILALTGNADAAQELTDKLYAIPTEREIQIIANTVQAIHDLDTYIGRLNSIPSVVTTEVRQFQALIYKDPAGVGETTGADGFIEEYARGGFSPGIYRGGAPIHKFAEPETIWEAYISGKPSERDRNRQIWVEAGDRLGMGDLIEALTAGGSGGNQIHVGGVSINAEKPRDQMRELEDTLSRLIREG